MKPEVPIVSLLSYRLHRLLLENVETDDGETMITVEAGVAKVEASDDRYSLRFAVRTSGASTLGAACIPRIEADIEGVFRASIKDGEPEQIEKAIRIYGGAQLYSLLRGLVSAPAAMFTPGNTVLPTLNMQSVMSAAKPIKGRGKRKTSKATKG